MTVSKKKKFIFSLVILMVILLCIGLFYFSGIPTKPRTILSVSKQISGLELSNDIKAEKIIDQWCSNGDGETYIKAQLTVNQLNKILVESNYKHYKKFPITEKHESFIPKEINQIKNGIYRIQVDNSDPRNIELAAIDIEKMIFYIYLSVM